MTFKEAVKGAGQFCKQAYKDIHNDLKCLSPSRENTEIKKDAAVFLSIMAASAVMISEEEARERNSIHFDGMERY